MNIMQEQVKEFHETFGIVVNDKPTLPDMQTSMLRVKLIHEELVELSQAMAEGDLVETADAIGDLLYVVFGTAVSCGIDMSPIMDEIHRSNMTKVGGHKRDDGKWVKPDTYEPAVLEPILVEQGWNPQEDLVEQEIDNDIQEEITDYTSTASV